MNIRELGITMSEPFGSRQPELCLMNVNIFADPFRRLTYVYSICLRARACFVPDKPHRRTFLVIYREFKNRA
jgi:hypothetical protein